MRFQPWSLLAGTAVLVGAQSLTQEENPKQENTYFNQMKVPPLLELTPSNWEAELKQTKYLLVKHYSPYCPHCIDYAPMYQTTYEYYYTSKPAVENAEDTSFLEYYDFRFGSINCVAYFDFCSEMGVRSYPMTILFENGENAQNIRGVKDVPYLSEIIEEVLEKAKPGSRPRSLDLPKSGAKQSPDWTPPKDLDETARSIEDDSVSSKDESKSTKINAKSDKEEDSSVSGSNSGASKQPEGIKGKKDSAKDSSSTTDGSETKAEMEQKPFGSNWKVPSPGELAKQQEPKKPAMDPNPNGVSVALTAESFQRLVTMTQDPWFIKFYAPWCPHCQAMGPTWEQLSKNMEGKLNIGEVNCDKEKRLCKDVRATSYPTLLFFKGGERAEYQGLRGLGDFVQYAEKALDLSHGVPDVTAKELAVLEEKEEVIFIYFYDHATTTEDFMALERIPLSLIGHAKLVKTSDPALFDRFKITTWPRLLVSREGRPTYYTPLRPDEMRDVRRVLDWMKSVWLPLVPELTASNARQIMDGKIVALGVLNRDDADSFQGAIREMKTAANEWMDRQTQEFQLERKKLRDAKQMRIEEAEDRDDQRALRAAKAIRIDMDTAGRKEVAFAWVDGVFWQRWIRTTFGIDVKDGERIIVNDQDRKKYWDNTATGNYILVSRTSIMETLDKIVYGPQVIKPKFTVSIIEKILFDIRVNFFEHPIISLACISGLTFVVVSWLRGRSRRAHGHFRLDDTMGIRELKDGLLGHNGNAKSD